MEARKVEPPVGEAMKGGDAELLFADGTKEGIREVSIAKAIEERHRGNSLQYNLLLHKLIGDDDTAVLELLDELRGLVVTEVCDGGELEEIVGHVLAFNFAGMVDSPKVLSAYEKLVMNLAASSAFYVEPCLAALCQALFLEEPYRDARERALSCMMQILDHHPAAVRLFVHVIVKNFPHHRKPAQELQSYCESLLTIAESAKSLFLSERIVNLVVERITVLDAEVTTTGDEGTEEESALQEKLDNMLYGILAFTTRNVDGKSGRSREFFDLLYTAFERIVLPVHRSHSAPYIVFLLCTKDPSYLKVADERLRASFFDAALPESGRCDTLVFSAGLIGRLKEADEVFVMRWVSSVVSFLHSYVDGVDEKLYFIDADLHRLFYVAFGCLMFVLVSRGETLVNSGTNNAEILRQARLLRIIRSPLNPLRLQHGRLCERFCELLLTCDVLDCSDVLLYNKSSLVATTTKWGRRNSIDLFFPFEPYTLPKARMLIQPHRIVQAQEELADTDDDKGDYQHDVDKAPISTVTMDTTKFDRQINSEPIPFANA